MSKNVLIISSSPRKGSNSETLAASFAKGAEEAGHKVETVYLREKNYGFCKGCLACLKVGHCVIDDDAVEIATKMHDADVLVFATPIYFYEMSGQMKTLLDRTNPLFPAKYAFGGVYLLATSADGDAGSMDGAVKGLEGWISCFPPARLAGVVRGTGADEKGAIRDKAGALAEAYEMGKNV